MFKQTILGKIIALSLIVSLPVLTGCDGGGGGVGSGENYNGPGSKWDANLAEDNTFMLTKRADVNSSIGLTITGDYERLSTGFLKLTVFSSQGTDGPSPGDQAWALEVPGYALLLKPMDPNNDQMIPMVTSGGCPTSNISANWVVVKQAFGADATDVNQDFFGQFNFDVSSNVASLPFRRALAGGFQDQGSESLGGSTCENGIMEISNAVMYLTANGGAIVHTQVNSPNDSSFIFALAQKEITNVANLDGNYAGMLFDDTLSNGSKIEPLSLSCTSGNCLGRLVTNVETGEVDANSVTVDLTGTVDGFGPGLITGSVISGGSGNLACMADVDVLGTGKKIISCVGQSPSNNADMFNVIFTSVDE